MAIAIQPTRPITGKQAEELLAQLQNKEGLRKDKLDFTVDPSFFDILKQNKKKT